MDLMVGQIMLTALTFAPTGTLACNGQLVASATYGALSALLGTSYGGNGTTTFGVPDIPPVPTQFGATLTWVIVADGAPWASGMEAAIGELRLLPAAPAANSTLAQTWFPCDGRPLQILQDEPLFALIGTMFGGDGVRTFDLPKLAPVQAANGASLDYWICNDGFFPPVNSGNSMTPLPGSYTFEDYLGVVLQLSYAPELTQGIDGLGLCLGQTISIATWTAVFSLLGARFGGNGSTSFQLPNRPAGSDHVTYAMVVNGYYPPFS